MTQPNPDEEAAKRAAADEAARKAAEKKAGVKVLDVVEYSHVDPLLGGEVSGLGVVVGIDDQGVDVVPLAHHRVRATADNVTLYNAG